MIPALDLGSGTRPGLRVSVSHARGIATRDLQSPISAASLPLPTARCSSP
jgi:hypothetical protein